MSAMCTGSKISVFEIFEEYEIVSQDQEAIQVIADDGVTWIIPLYHEDTYEVTDANGDKAIFVV